MITDTHAHLFYPEIISDIDNILLRAIDSGIERIIVPAVDLETSRTVIEMSEKHEMIYCAIGIHPCDVNKSDLKDLDLIEKLLDHEKVVGIGETGLDYYWDKNNSERQKSFFIKQIELAKIHKLPVIIHTRNSVDDAVEITRNNYNENLSGQFHCFSGNEDQLNKILFLDKFYVSYCGNITYKNFKDAELIKKTPLERMLSETDSPFLPPVPNRGKRNEPGYLIRTLEKIADLKETNIDQILPVIGSGVRDLFFRNN